MYLEVLYLKVALLFSAHADRGFEQSDEFGERAAVVGDVPRDRFERTRQYLGKDAFTTSAVVCEGMFFREIFASRRRRSPNRSRSHGGHIAAAVDTSSRHDCQ